MLVEAVGVFPVTAVGGPTRGLNVGDAVRAGTKDTEKGFGMHGARANFSVVGLLENAVLFVPEVHEFEDEGLKGEPFGFGSSFTCCFRFHDRPIIFFFAFARLKKDSSPRGFSSE